MKKHTLHCCIRGNVALQVNPLPDDKMRLVVIVDEIEGESVTLTRDQVALLLENENEQCN